MHEHVHNCMQASNKQRQVDDRGWNQACSGNKSWSNSCKNKVVLTSCLYARRGWTHRLLTWKTFRFFVLLSTAPGNNISYFNTQQISFDCFGCSQVHPTGFVDLKNRDEQMKTLSAEVIRPFARDYWYCVIYTSSGGILSTPIQQLGFFTCAGYSNCELQILRGVGALLINPQTARRFCDELGRRNYVTARMHEEVIIM